MDIAVALFGATVGQQRRPVGLIGRRETLEIADGTPLDVPTTVGRALHAVLEDVDEPPAAVREPEHDPRVLDIVAVLGSRQHRNDVASDALARRALADRVVLDDDLLAAEVRLGDLEAAVGDGRLRRVGSRRRTGRRDGRDARLRAPERVVVCEPVSTAAVVLAADAPAYGAANDELVGVGVVDFRAAGDGAGGDRKSVV